MFCGIFDQCEPAFGSARPKGWSKYTTYDQFRLFLEIAVGWFWLLLEIMDA